MQKINIKLYSISLEDSCEAILRLHRLLVLLLLLLALFDDCQGAALFLVFDQLAVAELRRLVLDVGQSVASALLQVEVARE